MARQGSSGRKVGKVHIVLDIFVCFARLSLSAGQNRVTIGNRFFFIRVPKLDGLLLSQRHGVLVPCLTISQLESERDWPILYK
jgi:hypothetical protein